MMKKFLALALAALLGTAAHLALAEEASVALGKKLFGDPTLGGGTTQATCNSCHQDGKGLEKAGDNPNLETVINACIVQALQGKKLDKQSVEMESLKLYITSLRK